MARSTGSTQLPVTVSVPPDGQTVLVAFHTPPPPTHPSGHRAAYIAALAVILAAVIGISGPVFAAMINKSGAAPFPWSIFESTASPPRPVGASTPARTDEKHGRGHLLSHIPTVGITRITLFGSRVSGIRLSNQTLVRGTEATTLISYTVHGLSGGHGWVILRVRILSHGLAVTALTRKIITRDGQHTQRLSLPVRRTWPAGRPLMEVTITVGHQVAWAGHPLYVVDAVK